MRPRLIAAIAIALGLFLLAGPARAVDLPQPYADWQTDATRAIWADCLAHATCGERTPQEIANSVTLGIVAFDELPGDRSCVAGVDPSIERVYVCLGTVLLGGAPAGFPHPGLEDVPDYVIECESHFNWRAVNRYSGAGGGLQFLDSTWHGMGGFGRPQDASESYQRWNGARLWRNGAGRGAWSCA